MKKKLYNSPLTEVASVNMSGTVLTGSPVIPPSGPTPPPGPAGAPARRTPVF